jgi:hypothetical protein
MTTEIGRVHPDFPGLSEIAGPGMSPTLTEAGVEGTLLLSERTEHLRRPFQLFRRPNADDHGNYL